MEIIASTYIVHTTTTMYVCSSIPIEFAGTYCSILIAGGELVQPLGFASRMVVASRVELCSM